MAGELERLREFFTLTWERYRATVDVTAHLVTGRSADLAAIATQLALERQAYELYRDALVAFLAAASAELEAPAERPGK